MRYGQKITFKIFSALIFILFFYVYISAETTKADGPFIEFELPAYHLLGWQIAETQDGYIVAGTAYDDSGPHQRALVIKTNKSGKALWKKEFGNGRSSSFYKIITVENGKAIILGGSVDARAGGPSEESTGLIVKLRSDGKVEWDKRIQLGRVTRVMDVALTRNGVVAVGLIRQGEHEDYGFIAEFGPKGELLWTSQSRNWLDFVYPLKTVGFLAGSGGRLAKLDNKGNILWENSLNDYKYDSLGAVIELADGDIVVGGQSGQYSSMSRFTSEGKQVWAKKIEIDGSCEILGLREFREGIKAIGSTCGTGHEMIWTASISSSGDTKAVRKYLTAGADRGMTGQAVIVDDDTFIAFGGIKGQEGTGTSTWIFKSRFEFEAEKDN
ncbi:MAG: PQQ-binding-like beta-propeller repeat protein [Deltaproteobacteria bacterium]|nr:PQQ-binding-like beta-propeller repeat protein [Deltaproteobacteria bacterium]